MARVWTLSLNYADVATKAIVSDLIDQRTSSVRGRPVVAVPTPTPSLIRAGARQVLSTGLATGTITTVAQAVQDPHAKEQIRKPCWRQLAGRRFALERQFSVRVPTPLQLAEILHPVSTGGPTAAASVYQAMKWFTTTFGCRFVVGHFLIKPYKMQGIAHTGQQAAELQPWAGATLILLGFMLQQSALSCIRFEHMQRSSYTDLVNGCMHFRCSQGKSHVVDPATVWVSGFSLLQVLRDFFRHESLPGAGFLWPAVQLHAEDLWQLHDCSPFIPFKKLTRSRFLELLRGTLVEVGLDRGEAGAAGGNYLNLGHAEFARTWRPSSSAISPSHSTHGPWASTMPVTRLSIRAESNNTPFVASCCWPAEGCLSCPLATKGCCHPTRGHGRNLRLWQPRPPSRLSQLSRQSPWTRTCQLRVLSLMSHLLWVKLMLARKRGSQLRRVTRQALLPTSQQSETLKWFQQGRKVHITRAEDEERYRPGPCAVRSWLLYPGKGQGMSALLESHAKGALRSTLGALWLATLTRCVYGKECHRPAVSEPL